MAEAVLGGEVGVLGSSAMREKLVAAANAGASNLSAEIRSERFLQVLTLRSSSNPGRFAEVSATGFSWYALTVDGGYTDIEVDEEASEVEIAEVIDRYVSAAKEYLEGRYEVRRSFPWGYRLVLTTPMGLVTLKRALFRAK